MMRVLIVYGSKTLGPAEIAGAMATAFGRRGIVADARPAESCPCPTGYDGVIVGSGVYDGRWLSAPTWFVRSNAGRLRETPVWFFSCGPLDQCAESPGLAPAAEVERLERLVNLKGHVTFGDHADPPPAPHHRAHGVVARLRARSQPTDRRDGTGAAAWADRIADLLISRRHHPSMTPSHAPNMES